MVTCAIIYINDLPLVPSICSLKSYVDDSKLYISFPVKDTNIVAGQLTEDLRRVAGWCCANSLLINPDKVKLLLLGTRQMLRKIRDDVRVTLLGKQIYPVSSAKDLGITTGVHSLATRNSNLLNIPSFKSASGQRSFHYRATKL